MSRNFNNLERELIDDLERRTGRSLAEWMMAIDDAGLDGKNAVIDWLRPQGFTFANASWLERIHNNGGHPIYLDQPASSAPFRPVPDPTPLRDPVSGSPLEASPTTRQVAPNATALPAAQNVRPSPPISSPHNQPQARPLPAIKASPPAAAQDVATLLARGKGLRPLADKLIRELERALPELMIIADGDLLRFYRPRELAALLVTPKELRLCLDLGEESCDAPLVKARVPGAGPRLTHMIVINDARQISPALLELAATADRHANPPPPGVEPEH